MSITPERFFIGILNDSSDTNLFTVDANDKYVITHISITNTSISDITLDYIRVGPPGSQREWRDTMTLVPDETVEWNGAMTMEASDIMIFKANASGASFSVIVTGLRFE